jgi:hypothetical protein
MIYHSIRKGKHANMHTHEQTSTPTVAHIHTQSQPQTQSLAYTHSRTHKLSHTRTHTYINIFVYIHVYISWTQTQGLPSASVHLAPTEAQLWDPDMHSSMFPQEPLLPSTYPTLHEQVNEPTESRHFAFEGQGDGLLKHSSTSVNRIIKNEMSTGCSIRRAHGTHVGSNPLVTHLCMWRRFQCSLNCRYTHNFLQCCYTMTCCYTQKFQPDTHWHLYHWKKRTFRVKWM